MKNWNSGLMLAIMGVVCVITIEVLMTSLDTEGWNPSVTVFVQTIVPIIFAATVIMATLRYFNADSSIEGTGTRGYLKRYRLWKEFGARMKEAYIGKFGYRNPAFDEDVDLYIKAVRAMGRGETKKAKLEHLKMMARFVEVPFVIPYEEVWCEEDKVRMYKRYAPEKGAS